MSKVQGLFNHLTVMFGMVFLVFLVLDQFNPVLAEKRFLKTGGISLPAGVCPRLFRCIFSGRQQISGSAESMDDAANPSKHKILYFFCSVYPIIPFSYRQIDDIIYRR